MFMYFENGYNESSSRGAPLRHGALHRALIHTSRYTHTLHSMYYIKTTMGNVLYDGSHTRLGPHVTDDGSSLLPRWHVGIVLIMYLLHCLVTP